MLRLTRALLLIAAAALIAAPTAADARAAPLQTLRLRVPIPAAGDLSILSFELSIGGEGRRHRRQLVSLKLVNHRETGVFAVERLRPVHGHLGRFLGVIEVFHRASAKAASLPAELDGFARASPFGAHAAREFNDEFFVRAHNEHVIKEKLKDNIVMLAEAHKIGPDEFCDPHNLGTYLLGSELIGAAYDQAGPVTGLPTNTDVSQLADDAVNELCDAVEDFDEEDFEEDDEEEDPGIEILERYLGVPPSAYRVGLSGAWVFEGADEVRFMGMLTGAWFTPLAHGADSRNPVDAIRVVLPRAGSTARAVTNYICPTQLPTATVTSTNSANDTLMCSGGSLPLEQSFSLNVQTSPPPAAGMGGQLLAHQDGAYLAPLSFGGP